MMASRLLAHCRWQSAQFIRARLLVFSASVLVDVPRRSLPQPKTWPPSAGVFSAWVADAWGRAGRGCALFRQQVVYDGVGPAPAGTHGTCASWEERDRRAGARSREKHRGPGRKHMRKLACGLVLTFVMVGSSTGAQAGPWCAFYDSSTYNCGFHSYAQCYATIYGNGGWCRPNFFEPSGRDRRSGKTRPPARY